MHLTRYGYTLKARKAETLISFKLQKTMLRKIFWWIVESIIWYLFFYLILFTAKNTVNIGVMALILVLVGSLGVFASPLTRHLSIWNKVLDEIIKKEEEKENY